MIQQNTNGRLAAFFERLLDLQAQRPSAEEWDRQQVQIVCGRWLALRRLHLGLSIDQLAEAAQIASRSILFVETGLADRGLEWEAGWERYVSILSTPPQDRRKIEQVLASALGCTPVPDKRVVELVLAEINAAHLSGALRRLAAKEKLHHRS